MTDLRDSIFNYIIKSMEKNKNSYFLSIDQGSFGYEILKKKFPQRCINIGIAEQNAIGIASGLALENKTVFVYAISSFIYSRAYEQIKLNLCSMNLKVCIISSGPGYCYAPDGPTHYSLDDISVLNSLPNMKIYSPYDDTTCKQAVSDFVNSKGPAYIRTDKGVFYQHSKASLGITHILKGKNNFILTHGYYVNLFSQKLKLLKQKKIGLVAINKLKPLNDMKMVNILQEYKNCYFIDDSWPNASFGLYLSKLILQKNLKIKIKIISSKEEFYKLGGKRDEIFRNLNIDANSVLSRIKN